LKIIGVIDIGTNSIRLGVVRIETNHEYTMLASDKEVVRLGEGEFGHNKITKPAMDRGLLVLGKFVDIARSYGASEIIAAATAAVREALNRAEFVNRARDEAGVDISVVSGVEEARLIYLGVVSGLNLNSSRALFVDIGGGTTELAVGDAKDYSLLESLKLGAVRLADMFLAGQTKSVSDKQYQKMIEYAQGVAIHATRKVREQTFDLAIGSSGTIMNLAEITARRVDGSVTTIRNYNLKYDDLAETIALLCRLDLDQRRNVPGINPDRADIIISGAAVLDTVMRETGATSIRISDRALRDGLIIDHLFQEDTAREAYLGTPARQRSILQLGRSCRFEEGHALKVSDLACSIFRQTGALGLHSYGKEGEELLRYAALAHDIGTFISYGEHQKHSYYLIRNWNLLGFDDEDIEIIATAAMCHRKQQPQKLRPQRLSEPSVRLTQVLASIIRLADALDRSQMGLVSEIICRSGARDKRLTLEIYASQDCPLEMWALESKKVLFEKTFGCSVSVKRIVS
jgi:exopolyphosphatase/guanosine-5'-triphosphate,3'-diphosphate pyrophosphatase